MAYVQAHTFDQVPLALEPEPGESPGSYCLRSLSAHGLNMHWLRRVAGLSYLAPPTRDDECKVAHVLQAPRGWLREALPERRDTAGAGWHYQGQRLHVENHLRLRLPQVCATCLHTRGYCQALWDFSLVTVCSEHGHQLIDHCVACGRTLSWDRPAVDICACGRPIRGGADLYRSETATVLDGIFAARLLGDVLRPQALEGAGLPCFLSDLSLNGLSCVVHAFGEFTGPYERAVPAALRRMRPTEEWRAVAERAGERLRQFATDPKSHVSLAAVVSEPILKRMRKYPLAIADIQVGGLLSRVLFGVAASEDARAQGQMDLFT